MDIAKLKVVELRKELSARGLSTSGVKKDLAKRLQDAVDAAEAGGEEGKKEGREESKQEIPAEPSAEADKAPEQPVEATEPVEPPVASVSTTETVEKKVEPEETERIEESRDIPPQEEPETKQTPEAVETTLDDWHENIIVEPTAVDAERNATPEEIKKRKRREDQPSPVKRTRVEEAPTEPSGMTAVYIENFTRPLSIPQLKTHLSSLAQEELDFFWMDSVRAHCFVELQSPEGANRLCQGIQGKAWPDEKDRKPLKAGVILVDKAKEWAAMDDKEPDKRFYISFDQGVRGGVLVEVERPAPKRPTSSASSSAPARSPADNAKDTVVLDVDTLFSKTKYKPVLYYAEAPPVRSN